MTIACLNLRDEITLDKFGAVVTVVIKWNLNNLLKVKANVDIHNV